MAYTYIDISQIKNKLVWGEGYDNTQGTWCESDLETIYNDYLLAANNRYIEIYNELEIDEADVKTFASGEMTETAKKMVVDYSYYRFFEDNLVNRVVEDPMYSSFIGYRKSYTDAYLNIKESDITAIIPGEDDIEGYWKKIL